MKKFLLLFAVVLFSLSTAFAATSKTVSWMYDTKNASISGNGSTSGSFQLSNCTNESDANFTTIKFSFTAPTSLPVSKSGAAPKGISFGNKNFTSTSFSFSTEDFKGKVIKTISFNAKFSSKATNTVVIKIDGNQVLSQDVASASTTKIEYTNETGITCNTSITFEITYGEAKKMFYFAEPISFTYEDAEVIPSEPQDYTYEFSDVNLGIGETKQLDLGEKHPDITFVTDEAIATIDQNGLITAVAAGTTTVIGEWEASDEWTAGTCEFDISVTAPAVGNVVVTPAPVEGVVTVTKGEKVSFYAENASKMKVELIEADNVTTNPGDTYEYTATADEMITVTPIDANGVEQTELSVTVSVEIVTAPLCGEVTFNPAGGEVKAGTEVTISAENAAYFIFYALNAEGDEMFEATRKDSSSFTYTVTEECTLAATPYNSDDVAGEEGMATYTIEVVEGFTDDLTTSTITNINGNSYKIYNHTSDNNIEYQIYANIAASSNNSAFSIRQNSELAKSGGIVVTKSDMMASSVSITQWSQQDITRTAFVYGSEKSFTAADNIDANNLPEGSVRIGEAQMTKGEAVAVELNAYYPYIAILSENGALQMTKVSIDWVARFAAPAVDLDHQGKLSEGGKVTFTLSHAKENARIFYMHQPQQAKAAVRRAPSHSDEGWLELTEGNTVDINAVGDFHVYASDATGKNRSEINSFAVKDATTTGISEVEAGVSGEAEWFDLQGRRVSAPAKGNIYILKEGNKVSKRAF